MKNIKLLTMFMLLAAAQILDASAPTKPVAAADGSFMIINKSDMTIAVATAVGGQGYTWVIIGSGAQASVPYKAGQAIDSIHCYYYAVHEDATKSDPIADGVMVLNSLPTFTNKSVLYVYGHKAFTTAVLDTTVAATPVPARYCVWSTGVLGKKIDSAVTVALASNDHTMRGKLAMYKLDTQGNTIPY